MPTDGSAPGCEPRARDRSRRGAAQTASPAARRARRSVVDVHQGPLRARHRARSGRSARDGAESVASRSALRAGFSIPRERRTENGVALRVRAVSLDRSTEARFASFASHPASALVRNLVPRPARALGLGKCRHCRPGVPTSPAHFFVRQRSSKKIAPDNGDIALLVIISYGQMVSIAALLFFIC